VVGEDFPGEGFDFAESDGPEVSSGLEPEAEPSDAGEEVERFNHSPSAEEGRGVNPSEAPRPNPIGTSEFSLR